MGMSQPLNIDTIVKLPPTIKLSHFASHGSTSKDGTTDHKRPAPVPFVACISCGSIYPSDQYHPVPYKTVIAHFEQVITLLTVDMTYQNSNGTLEWPPDPAIVTAAGGVGFGGVKLNPESSSRDNICLEDVTIPPVIRQLHTKLTAPAYRRYRKDPLFLYKTAMCCENCFLVYAELASTDFQIAPPPKNRGKGGNDGSGRQALSDPRYHQPENRGRTPNDKWLPMGDGSGNKQQTRKRRSNNNSTTTANNNYMNTQESSEFVSQQPPNFPDAIRSVAMNYEQEGTRPVGNTSNTLDQSQQSQSQYLAPRMTEEIIQKREDAFFKEMLNNHQPSKSHPLTHLITAQSKLESLRNSNGNTGETEIDVSNLNLGAKNGNKNKNNKTNPYEMPQKFVEVTKGGKIKNGKKKKRGLHNNGESHSVGNGNGGSSVASGMSSAAGGGGGGGGSNALPLSTSAARHREFLMGTLNDIQKQLAAPTALKTLVDGQDIAMKKNTEFQGGGTHGLEAMTTQDLPDDAKGNESVVGLFKTNTKISEKMCSISCFASQAWEDGPHQITLLVLERGSGERFRISITEDDLGFDEGVIASMPVAKLKLVAKKSLGSLSWASGVGGDGDGGIGLIYISTA